jgi:hypothetical protein
LYGGLWMPRSGTATFCSGRCWPTPIRVPPALPLQTAHVGALYAAFLAMMLTAGVPAVIAALSLGFMSNLFGSITHFVSLEEPSLLLYA